MKHSSIIHLRFEGILDNFVVIVLLLIHSGMPKPAVITQSKFVKAGVLFLFFVNVTPDDVYYIAMPMYHSGGLLIATCGALAHG